MTGMQCPCGSKKPFDQCCQRMLSGQRFATTAEELMRSRYSAFVTENGPYLLNTWHPRTRPASVDFMDNQVWTGLEIVSTTKGQMLDTTGTVEFIASFTLAGATDTLHERSLFERLDGKWMYVDDDLV